jgi:hypothetical protein
LQKKKGIYVSTEYGKGGSKVSLAQITPFFKGRKDIYNHPDNIKEGCIATNCLIEMSTSVL